MSDNDDASTSRYPTPLKPGFTILEEEIVQASGELARPTGGLFLSGLMAGFAVSISVLAMAVLLTLATDMPELVVELLLANAFTIGFIIVVLAHADLFTEYTTITLLPVFDGRATVASAARLWGIVYLSNQMAAWLFALVAVWLGPALGSVELEAFKILAEGIVQHDTSTMLVSATLAGWMMGLLSWLVSAGRETISQVFFVWLITFTIAIMGLHHCITGATEVLTGVLTGHVSWAGFIRFLVLSTLGNTLGSIVFAVMVRYSVVVGARRTERGGKSGGRQR